jgi:hypothetical protein
MKRLVFLLVLTVVVALPIAAQEPPPSDSARELHAAMRRHFENRLRAELSLSDEQVEQIVPRMNELEASRQRTRRERGEVMRRLRSGMEGGASDADLLADLRELERFEIDQREMDRTAMAEIDESLTARQQVQLRFFVQRFREQMQERVRALRGNRSMPGMHDRRGDRRREP